MNLYIVTGTTRGIGRALADAIKRAPENHLIELSRPEVDLDDLDAAESAFDRVQGSIRGKRYDKAVLVNNAGVVGPVGPLEAVDAPELRRNLNVNLVAPILLMRRFLMATEGAADIRRIINISSGAGRRPIFGWTAYCAAKAGLDMASRVVALEAQARGTSVEVASLAPGVVDTAMQAHVRSLPEASFADVGRFRQMKETGELRAPEAVAEEILRAECEGRLRGDAVLDLRSLTQ